MTLPKALLTVSSIGIICLAQLIAQPTDINSQFEAEEPQQPPTLEEKINSFIESFIIRPATHVGPFEAIIVEFSYDGVKGQHMALKGPEISLKSSVPHQWQEDVSLTSKYSYTLSHRYVPSVLMTYTVFSKSSFPLTYDESSIIAYLAGLKKIHSDRFLINNMPPSFRDSGFNAHLLSNDTIYLDYSIVSRSGKEPSIRYLVYYVLVEDNWIELSLFGPEDAIQPIIPVYKRYLRNLSVVQNEAEAFGL